MQYNTFIAAAMVLFASTSLAQTIQSAPFNLIVDYNGQYNGTGLQSCHEGAAIQSLCLGRSSGQFRHNTTSGAGSSAPGDGPSGILTWFLDAGASSTSEAMILGTDGSTNVAHPQFHPNNAAQATLVAFDVHNSLNIVTNNSGSPTATYRWVVCQTNVNGYPGTTLNWISNGLPPQNPSCVSASVRRVFV